MSTNSTSDREPAGDDESPVTEPDSIEADDVAYDGAADRADDGEVVVKARKRPAASSVDGRPDAPGASGSASAGKAAPRQITLSVRTLLIGLVGLLVASGLIFGVVDNFRVRGQLNDIRSQQSNNAKAEQVAGEYAVRAATLDYKDLTPWAANLKKGVSPQLSKQFDVAVPAMQQILTPVRMSTTATLVSAKTTDVAGDIYRVTAVVEVTTKSLQTPDGASSLAAYVLTLNKADNWLITAVGDQASPGSPKLPGMPQQGQSGDQPTQPAQPTAPNPAPGG